MNQNDTQLEPNQAAASLSFATSLSDKLLKPQEQLPESPQDAPQPTPTSQPEVTPDGGNPAPQIDFKAELESIKNDVKDTVKEAVKEEISGLRKLIEKALNEEGD